LTRFLHAKPVPISLENALAILDKSQVIALDLIRRKIGKNPRGLIRRKFLIDAPATMPGPHPPIRNHAGALAETRHSPSARATHAKFRRSRGVLPRIAPP